MQLNAALRERNRNDYERAIRASESPHRRDFDDPLDPRLECQLGRLRVEGIKAEKAGVDDVGITEAEYQAGVRWRNAFNAYLHSIQNPEDLTQEQCDIALAAYKKGLNILEKVNETKSYKKRTRVLHAVNAIAVYEDPEELGDYQFTVTAARVGLAALAVSF